MVEYFIRLFGALDGVCPNCRAKTDGDSLPQKLPAKMKKIIIILAFISLTFVAFGQNDKKKSPSFDIADFNKKFEVAEWLVKYDLVAWKTSDVLMTQDKKELERLGREWFCFQDKNGMWHAIYGKYENGKFDLVFHFTMDSASKITRTNEKVDAEFLNSHARALNTAHNQMAIAVKDAVTPRFNQYIKQNADKTFTVWLLPAFQTNGVAVYGGEFIYTIDQTGNKITKDESYFQGNFRGFKADNPREIWLNYRDTEQPTLGAIFFVWYYKQYFTKIFIDNSKSTSTVIQNADKNYLWVHVEKEPEAKDKDN